MKTRIQAMAVMMLLFLQSPSFGQERESGVKIRILTFGKITGKERLQLLDPETGDVPKEVELRLNNFTGPYHSESRKVVLAESRGTAAAIPMASVSIPESYETQVLIVLVPKGKAADGYLAVPVRDDLEEFTAGERRFVNLTSFPIGAEFDGKRSLVKANTVTSLELPKPPEGRRVHEAVFYYQVDKEWKPLTSSVWPYDPEARSLVFFYWHGGEKRIRIQSISELPK